MWAELPYVAQPVGDVSRATRAAQAYASAHGLQQPVLLRVAMNAIFAAGRDVVLRVGHTTAPPEHAANLAERLLDAGVRVPHQLGQPAAVDGLAVAAVERIHPSGTVDWVAVGRMIRRVHQLDVAEVAALSPLPRADRFPWWRFDEMLDELADDLDPAAVDGLRAAVDQHLPTLRAVADEDLVVCHGDVHVGNVLASTSGPVLLDWDLVCAGPPHWDHGALATLASHWGGDPHVLRQFVAGYGADLSLDPLGQAIAQLRLVAATLLRVGAGRSDPAARAESERRLRTWRGDPSAPAWTAQ